MSIPLSKTLVAALTLLFVSGQAHHQYRQECNLTIEIKSTKIAEGTALFNVTIDVQGGSSPYNYVLLDKNSKLLSYDHSKRDYKDIQLGRYRCIVVDSQNCKQEKIFDVK